VRAVHWVAEHAFELLGDYVFHAESGEWSHRNGLPQPVARLANVDYSSGGMSYPAWEGTQPESALMDYLREATDIVQFRAHRASKSAPALPPTFEEFRWFPLPGEYDAPSRTATASGFS